MKGAQIKHGVEGRENHFPMSQNVCVYPARINDTHRVL